MSEFSCQSCEKRFSIDEPRWRCDCGGILDLDFNPSLDISKVRKGPLSLWRYKEALPLPEEAIVSLGESITPLLAIEISGKKVLIKQEQLFSTGSYKDRGAAVMISMAAYQGIDTVVEDSSGNAGCSVAAYCAKTGIKCRIFVPADNSKEKLGQIRLYGAELIPVAGSREDTAEACMAAAENTFYASHVYNPYFFHGTKTFAYELVEQLDWKAPDSVVLPVGNGTLLIGAYIGFKELTALKIIEKMPKLIAIQSAACAPLSTSYNRGKLSTTDVQPKQTLAEGIAILKPRRGEQILKAVAESQGSFITVNEEEILSAFRDMGLKGHCIEPTSAATIAGVKKYIESGKEDGLTVSLFSGHGLKSGSKLSALTL